MKGLIAYPLTLEAQPEALREAEWPRSSPPLKLSKRRQIIGQSRANTQLASRRSDGTLPASSESADLSASAVEPDS